MKAPGCNNLKHAAGQYLSRQIKTLDKHLVGCQVAEDPESIHQARVACKRIQLGLNTYDSCFKKKNLNRWQTSVTRLTQRLGKARDLDIHILSLNETLNTIADNHSELAEGITQLLNQLIEKREAAQPKIAKTVTQSKLLDDINKLKNAAAKAEKTKLCCKRGYCKKLRKYTAQITLKQIKQFDKLQYALDNPDDIKSHHQFRLAAKHLRYTLEITSPFFNDKFKQSIDTIKSFQDLLGKLHDTDNSLTLLEAFADESQSESTTPAIAYLADIHRKNRAQLFEQARTFQQNLEQQQTIDKLTQLLHDKTS